MKINKKAGQDGKVPNPATPNEILDTRGLHCPIPIVNTKTKMQELGDQQTLLVITTDPSFAIDCAVYLRQSGNKLLQSWQEQKEFYYVLQKNLIV